LNPQSGFDLAFSSVTATSLSLPEVIQGMVVSLVLGLIVSVVYRVSVAERIVPPATMGMLVLLTLVSSMVMMVVGNNLARAFSLVGALSIIRFRTQLQTPWDISFVFFSLAAGTAAGTAGWPVAFGGTLVVTLAVLALSLTPLGGLRTKVSVLRTDVAAYNEIESRIEPVLEQYVKRRWLMETRSMRFGETLSYRWRVILKDDRQQNDFLRALAGVEGVERIIMSADEHGSGESD
jgi:hypothetical protein